MTVSLKLAVRRMFSLLYYLCILAQHLSVVKGFFLYFFFFFGNSVPTFRKHYSVTIVPGPDRKEDSTWMGTLYSMASSTLLS